MIFMKRGVIKNSNRYWVYLENPTNKSVQILRKGLDITKVTTDPLICKNYNR